MGLPLDLRYNLRLLAKNYGFVAICVLMIGIGMGSSITLYSVADNISSKQLPFANGDRFVDVYGSKQLAGSVSDGNISDGYIYLTLAESVRSFEVFGAYREAAAIFSDGDVSERFQAASISPELIQATAVMPILGRNLQVDDAQIGAEAVALISYRLWQNYYMGSADIIGTVSRINALPHTIIGVMPEGFSYPIWHDVWTPLQLPTAVEPGEYRGINIKAVLAEGISLETAALEVDSLLAQLGKRLPQAYQDLGGRVEICCSVINFDGTSPDQLLMPALATALLLLVCLNVGNLILVRTNQRIHEFTIRSALGATRWRLILSVLQDSLLICVLGSVLGFFLAQQGMAYVDSAGTQALAFAGGLPYWFNFDWEFNTVVVALGIVFFVWFLSAGLAIYQIARQDLSVGLASGKTGATGSRNAYGTAVMVSIEIIFSCFLLVLTLVLIGASIDTANTDYGTTVDGVLTGKIELPNENFSSAQSRDIYRQNLRQELLAQQGIEAVSFVTALPSEGHSSITYAMEEQDVRGDNEYPVQGVVFVESDYFNVMDVKLVTGRGFDASDAANTLAVVIINEVFARQHWSNQPDPVAASLGQRIQVNPGEETAQWLTIVGVITHIVQGPAMNGRYESTLYRPLNQQCCNVYGRSYFDVSVVLKVTGDEISYAPVLQTAAARVDKNVPIAYIYTLSDWLKVSNSLMVFVTEVSAAIAVITLLLAVAGIYAIVSRSVRQRTKEIGIRRAIGSSNAKVLWVFIRQGLRYLGLGLMIGGGAAVIITNTINTESTNLLSWLPLSVVSVSLGLGLLVFIATYVPARLLVAMEPGETLRDE